MGQKTLGLQCTKILVLHVLHQSHVQRNLWFAEVSVLQIHWDQAYCRSKVQFCFAKGLWSLAHRQLLFNCSFKWAVKALQFMRVSLLFLLFAETHLRSFLTLGTMTGWYIFLNTKHLVSERTKIKKKKKNPVTSSREHFCLTLRKSEKQEDYLILQPLVSVF